MKLKLFVLVVSVLLLCSFSVHALKDTIDLNDYEVEYSYDESSVLSGDNFRISITLTNVDNINHTDIEFRMEDEFPFEFDDNDFDIDVLEPDESKSKTFRVFVDADAESEDYPIDFTIEDDEDDYEGTIDIDVESINPDIIVADVYSSPLTLQPGLEDVELTIALENIGEGNAYFLRAKMDLPNGFEPSTSYSDTANFGTLDKGERKEASFFIDTNQYLEEGKYEGKLELDYEDEDNNQKSKTLSFDLPIKGNPNFVVSTYSTTPLVVEAGTSGDLYITVKNVGAEKGEETSVRVYENSDLPFSFDEKTSMIGTLYSGQSGTAVFPFTVSSDAFAKDYIIKIQIRSVNGGNVIVDDASLRISVVEKQGSGITISTILIALFAFLIVLIIVAAILLIRVLRK